MSSVELIVLDKVERNWKHMAKHIEEVKKQLLNECPKIVWENSEKEKGIQVADAICGAVSRKYNKISALDYFNIIQHLCRSIAVIKK